jgi:hypothetical protein
VYHYFGTSNNNTGLPETYPYAGGFVTTPFVQLIWNDTTQWWEATFPANGFGGFIAGSAGNFILPTNNLLAFDVAKAGNQGVINWVLNAGHTAKSFVVEKSYNGTSFTPMQKLEATSATNYSVKDAPLQTGLQYYRLAVLDKDGTTHYSAIKSLLVTAPTTVSVSPNPVSNLLYIKLRETQPGKLNAKLLNVHGQTVLAQNTDTYIGANKITLQVGHLAAGIYFLHCTNSNGENTVIRIVKNQ